MLSVSECSVHRDGEDRWRVDFIFDFPGAQDEAAAVGLDPGFNFNMARLTGVVGGVARPIAEDHGPVPKAADLESWIETWFLDHLVETLRDET